MNGPDPEKLLGGWATGTLTKSEREILMRAALEDPSIFEQFVEEDDWRGALDDEDFRRQLRARLQHMEAARPRPWYHLLSVAARNALRPQLLLPASALAAVAVVMLIRQGVISETSPVAGVVLGPGTIPALHAAGLLEQPAPQANRQEQQFVEQSRSAPPRRSGGGSLGLDRSGSTPTYSLGDRQRIGISVARDSNVLLVEERGDGSVVRLFPNKFQSSPSIKASQTVLVPPAGQGDLAVEGPPGRRTLRLLIFPPDVDPLSPDVDWNQARQQASVVEKHYQVQP